MQIPVRDNITPLVSYSAPVRRRWYQRWWVVAGLSILVFGAVAALPSWRLWKSWQARRLAATADAYVRANDFQRAMPFIQQADRLDPNDPVVLGIKGHFLTRAHAYAAAIPVWERILRGHYALTPENRLDYAAAALDRGQIPKAVEQLGLFRKQLPGGAPTASLLEARLSERTGDRSKATQAALQVLGFEQATKPECYDAALLVLANAPDVHSRAQAWSMLGRLAEGPDAIGLQALAFLASQQLTPSVSTEGREGFAADPSALIQRLGAHPLVTPAIRLAVLELRFRQDPSQADALVTKAIADYRGGDDNTVAALCRWLLSHKGAAEVLRVLPVERVMKSRALFPLRMEALAAASEWGLVEKELGDPALNGQMDDFMVALYLARSAARLGKMVSSDVNWDRAVQMAGGDRRKLLIVGSVAESEHQSERAETAYRAIVALAPTDLSAYTPLLRFVAEHGGAAASFKVLAAMVKQWPDDPTILSSEIYTGLLCGEVPPEKARETMERLVREYPASAAYRPALGLALLRQNEPEAALRILGEPFDPGAPAGAQAALVVHAAALSATGQPSQAKREAVAVAGARRLLPEENALLQPLLAEGGG